MKRILLDENVPLKLVDLAPPHCEVHHVLGLGWAHMPDGELLASAEAAGFEVFLTADQSIAYQQNLSARRISLVVLTSNNWPVVRALASTIFTVACAADVGVVERVLLPKLGDPNRL